jgi:hypothetical protein
MTVATKTSWMLRGRGYEYCNCSHGCGCNFGGFPTSPDGSCKALVGMHILEGQCGDVKLAGVKCAAVVAWPQAIHEGNGRCVFIVAPETTDEQVAALGGIFSGQLGGLPWELLGPTMQVVGLHKVPIVIEGEGRRSSFTVQGIGEGRGAAFKNPVTGEEHLANIDLPDGFIWKRGECGTGTFNASADGVTVGGDKTNWIYYEFDWSNTK